MQIVINLNRKLVRRLLVGSLFTVAFVTLIVPAVIDADSVSVPHTFMNGEVADADEVNANFQAMQAGVNDNDIQILQLKDTLNSIQKQLADQDDLISALQGRTADLETAAVTAEEKEILSHMSIANLDDGLGTTLKTIRFNSVNVQIVNGTGNTISKNGLGNLIIGYQESRPGGEASQRTGSHNVVIGLRHNYSSFGGLVVGLGNNVSGAYSSVTGGTNNTASGLSSAVCGGSGNTAAGIQQCTVLGGAGNLANGRWSTVGGGSNNTAEGWAASVSGGIENLASGPCSSVSGGRENTASGTDASITAGLGNRAEAELSSITGGGPNAVIDGGGGTIPGRLSTISGGVDRLLFREGQWKAGGLFQDIDGTPNFCSEPCN